MASSEAEGSRHAVQASVRSDGRSDRELVRREADPGSDATTHEGSSEREQDLGAERGVPRIRFDLPGPAVGLASVGGRELRVSTAPGAGRDDRADERSRPRDPEADGERVAHHRTSSCRRRGRRGPRDRKSVV